MEKYLRRKLNSIDKKHTINNTTSIKNSENLELDKINIPKDSINNKELMKISIKEKQEKIKNDANSLINLLNNLEANYTKLSEIQEKESEEQKLKIEKILKNTELDLNDWEELKEILKESTSSEKLLKIFESMDQEIKNLEKLKEIKVTIHKKENTINFKNFSTEKLNLNLNEENIEEKNSENSNNSNSSIGMLNGILERLGKKSNISPPKENPMDETNQTINASTEMTGDYSKNEISNEKIQNTSTIEDSTELLNKKRNRVCDEDFEIPISYNKEESQKNENFLNFEEEKKEKEKEKIEGNDTNEEKSFKLKKNNKNSFNKKDKKICEKEKINSEENSEEKKISNINSTSLNETIESIKDSSPEVVALLKSDKFVENNSELEKNMEKLNNLVTKESNIFIPHILNNLESCLFKQRVYYCEFDMINRSKNMTTDFMVKEYIFRTNLESFENVKLTIVRKGKQNINNLLKSMENFFKIYIKKKDIDGSAIIKGVINCSFEKLQKYFTMQMRSFEYCEAVQMEVFMFKWDLFYDYNEKDYKTNLKGEMIKQFMGIGALLRDTRILLKKKNLMLSAINPN